MKRAFHESINTVLRTAMASMAGGDRGTGGLFGCYVQGERIRWESLDGLNEALAASMGLESGSDALGFATLLSVLEALGRAFPVDAYGTTATNLRGLALICNVEDPDRGRGCIADAVFDDQVRHTVTWFGLEITPEWSIYGQDELDFDHVPQLAVLPDLLAVIQAASKPDDPPAARWPSRFDRDAHERLNTQLRGLVGADMTELSNKVLLIKATPQGWEVEADFDLTLRIAIAVAEDGLDEATALERLAEQITADPDREPPEAGLAGLALLVHRPVDGTLLSGISAVCDDVVHLVTWDHGKPAPAWEIVPIEAAEPDVVPIAGAHRRLLRALQGKD